MAFKPENESTYALLMFKQVIESQMQEVGDFFMNQVIPAEKEGNIESSYREQLEMEFTEAHMTSTVYLNQIDEEISKRIMKKFPSLLSYKKLEKIAKDFYELLPEKEEKKEPNLNVVRSREKEHDNKS